jgi:hypothetical protein
MLSFSESAMTSKLLQRYKTLQVVVAVPSQGVWTAAFGRDLVQLAVAVSTHKIGEYKQQIISFFYVQGSILTKSRREAVLEARKLEADYLLFIDSDQTFPRTILHSSIARDVDVLAANVATKQIPAQPTARNKGATSKDWITVYTDPSSTGLEKVDRIGTGVFMISKKVIDALPNDAFDMRYREDVDAVQGEDWSMCEAIEKLGFPIYIDHDLSKKIGHVGYFTYTHEVVGELSQFPLEEKAA